jgi:mono/diheme cytochrome c family protein
MNFDAHHAMRRLAAVLAACVFAGCSGPSTYHNSANPPIALASVIGAEPTSTPGGDPLNFTARSQAQITLTGNASSGGDAAIGNFTWAQTDPSTSPQAKLLYLDSDTVTFTAPTVAQDTTLHFTLTVTTAGNAAATAHVVIVIKAVNDPDQFLAFPKTAIKHFQVALAAVEGLTASPTAPNVPVCVTLNRQVNYTSRAGHVHDGTNAAYPPVILPALHRDTSWNGALGGAAAIGGVGSFGSYTNPRVSFDIPALNQDDVAFVYNNPVAGTDATATATRTANLDEQLVPSDIGLAQLSLTVGVAPNSCDGTAVTTALDTKTLQVAVQDQSRTTVVSATGTAGAPPTTATFVPDDLVSQQANSQYETADTARAYYDANDPTAAKTSLNNWLTNNCFDPTAANYGVSATSSTSAHAIYTNNYDLGFGRDMYFTICTATSPAVVSGAAKVGDMAAVVLNYASLEAAASKLNPINAVAMEYSAATDGSSGTHRFPKFYIFAPNDRDGSFQRVLSANFDHRGEKYLPGACVVCHGGTVPTVIAAKFSHPAMSTATKYPTVTDPTKPASQLGLGDVDAGFMPWDLDSFLYADTDTSFVGLSVNKSLYTRSAMEPNLKKLNQLAYCTYQPEIEAAKDSLGNNVTLDRLLPPRRLMASWYGGTVAGDGTVGVDASCAAGNAPTASLLPNSYVDTAVTPPGWTAQVAPAQVSAPTLTSDQLYHQMFARNCRACHTMNAKPTLQFSGFLASGTNTLVGDGYLSFINEFAGTQPTDANLGKSYIFQQGRMPLARLTMDRFWVDYSNGVSGASILAAHISQITGETDLLRANANAPTGASVPAGQEAVPTGQPVVVMTVDGSAAPTATPAGNPLTGDYPATRFTGASIDTTMSFFVANYAWSLGISPIMCLQAGNAPAENACLAAASPIASPPIVGTASAAPGLGTTRHGFYELMLTANSGLGGAGVNSAYEITIPDLVPTLPSANCPLNLGASFSTTGNGTQIQLPIGPCFSPAGDAPFTVQISYDNGQTYHTTIPDATTPAVLQWNASVPPGPQTTVPAIAFNFTQNATSNFPPVTYQLCDIDAECAVGSVTVALLASFGVSNATITAYLNPTLNTGYYSAGTIFVPPPPAVAISSLSSPSLSMASLNGGTLNLDAPSFDLAFTNFSGGSLQLSTNPGVQITDLTGTPTGITNQVNLLQFLPPTLTPNCDVKGNCGTAAASFNAALTYAGTTKPIPPAIMTINIQALTSFSTSPNSKPGQQSIYAIMSQPGSCGDSGCHLSGGGGGDGFWAYVMNDPATTYANIKHLLTPGDPTGIVYTAPCISGFGTMTQIFAQSTSQCQIFYQWILEGAQEN